MADVNYYGKGSHTLGRGKILFALPSEEAELRWYDLGNAPSVTLSSETEDKEHFSSREGLKIKDQDIVIQLTHSMKFTLDEPIARNLSYFFLSEAPDDAQQSPGIATDEEHIAYVPDVLALGHRKISSVVVTDRSGPPPTVYAEGVDFEVDYENGLIYFLESGTIVDETEIYVSYEFPALKREYIKAGSLPTIKGHIQFLGQPPVGKKIDVKGYVNLQPDGELDLISEDWTTIQFIAEFITHSAYEKSPLIYVDTEKISSD